MTFFKRRHPTPAAPQPAAIPEILVRQYLAFCSNPLRGEEQLRREFEVLAGLPKVKRVAFYNPHTLIIGTTLVTIRHPEHGTYHDVGEFLIFLIRKRVERAWEVTFRFNNVSGDIYGNSGYHHPHITSTKYDGLDFDTGGLCIQKGRFHVYQHIRKGEIHLAVPLLIDILHTFTVDYPYHDLSNWPRSKHHA